jgi:hypothetical protein
MGYEKKTVGDGMVFEGEFVDGEPLGMDTPPDEDEFSLE